MNAELKNWIDQGGKQYQEGVRLLNKYGSDERLKALFLENESEYKRQRLKKAIHELLLQAPASVSADPLHSTTSAVNKTSHPAVLHGGWPAGSRDPVIQALYGRFKPIYSELMNLQARIYEVALIAEKGDPNKQIEAAEMTHRILDLDDQLEAIYLERDIYLRDGHLPQNSTPEHQVADPCRWALELRNCERYIREYRLKITKQPDHAKVVKWTQKLKDLQEQASKLKVLLKIE